VIRLFSNGVSKLQALPAYIVRSEDVGYVLYSLHVCVWARQIQQLYLMIPLVVLFVSCASIAS
jgi:hypothetical protein